MPTHYEVLNIPNSADIAAIKRAYRALALTHHPDKTLHLPNAERQKRERRFKLATSAYEVLSDTAKRASYDRTLRSTLPTPRPPPPAQPRQPAPAPPPPPPNVEAFSSGALPTDPSSSQQPWFFAPVVSVLTRTLFTFQNHQSWAFSIGLTQRYKLLQRPVVQTDTPGQIGVTFWVQRDNTAVSAFIKEVRVTVEKTPGGRDVALSSLFVESRVDGQALNSIELRVSLATRAAVNVAGTWSAAFDVDCGFLAGFYQRLRVTHLVFWPEFPSAAFTADGEVPGDAKDGSPMCYVKQVCPEIVFVRLGKAYYCQEHKDSSRRLWRVAAVGTM